MTEPLLQASPGTLPPPENLRLPPGRLVHSQSDAQGGPLLWVGGEDLAEPELHALWHRLAEAYPATGLWPVLLDGLDGLARPWLAGELGAAGDPAGADLWAVLRGDRYDQPAGLDIELDPPTVPVPTELAPGSAGPASWPDGLPSAYGVGLVPVLRPADVPARIGWEGPVNFDLSPADVSVVLRSWEERFGAYVVGIGFDTLRLHVSRPPEHDALEALRAEHYAFCPDNIDQGLDPEAYLGLLEEESTWTFWWD